MNIGIIGAGKVGVTLAELLAKAGHKVAISNSRGPESLKEIVKDLGPNVVAATADEAAAFGEVVIEAIPYGRFKELPVETLSGKVVVSASNYSPERDGYIDFGGLTQTELLAQHLSGSKVVKAFNTIYWEHLHDHADHTKVLFDRRGIPIAGDDAGAKALVKRLIEDIGFSALDVGRLAYSDRQETSLHGRPHRL